MTKPDRKTLAILRRFWEGGARACTEEELEILIEADLIRRRVGNRHGWEATSLVLDWLGVED
jgi:hypothetical protein